MDDICLGCFGIPVFLFFQATCCSREWRRSAWRCSWRAGVWYNASLGQWCVFDGSFNNMPLGAEFSVDLP